MLDDGVYGLSFESRASVGASLAIDHGEGIAILRDGQILGSDRHGGVFKGKYAFDAARGDTLVKVRLAVPPHGILLNGYAAGSDGAMVDVSARFQRPSPVSSAIVEVAGADILVQLRYVGALSS